MRNFLLRFKVDKSFISKIDKRLAAFNRTHPKSAAQQAEIKKYDHIYALRDKPLLRGKPKKDIFDFDKK